MQEAATTRLTLPLSLLPSLPPFFPPQGGKLRGAVDHGHAMPSRFWAMLGKLWHAFPDDKASSQPLLLKRNSLANFGSVPHFYKQN